MHKMHIHFCNIYTEPTAVCVLSALKRSKNILRTIRENLREEKCFKQAGHSERSSNSNHGDLLICENE